MAWFAASLLLPWWAAYVLVGCCDRRARRDAAGSRLRAALAMGLGLGLSSCGYFLWMFLAGPPGTLYHACDLRFLRPSASAGCFSVMRRRRACSRHCWTSRQWHPARGCCWRPLLPRYRWPWWGLWGCAGGIRWAIGTPGRFGTSAPASSSARGSMAASVRADLLSSRLPAAGAEQQRASLVVPGRRGHLGALAAGRAVHLCHGGSAHRGAVASAQSEPRTVGGNGAAGNGSLLTARSLAVCRRAAGLLYSGRRAPAASLRRRRTTAGGALAALGTHGGTGGMDQERRVVAADRPAGGASRRLLAAVPATGISGTPLLDRRRITGSGDGCRSETVPHRRQ